MASLKKVFIIKEALAPDSSGPGQNPHTPEAERIRSAVEMFVNHHDDYDGKPIRTNDSEGSTVIVGFKDGQLAKKFAKDIEEFLEDTDDGKVEHGEITVERMHSEYPWTVFIEAPKSAAKTAKQKPEFNAGED